MDVSGLFGALTGGNNVKIDVVLNTPQTDAGIVAMDHVPSWKLHRNPFWTVKHSLAPRQHQEQQPQPMYDAKPMDQAIGNMSNMHVSATPGLTNNLQGSHQGQSTMYDQQQLKLLDNTGIHPGMSAPQQSQMVMNSNNMMSPPALVSEGFRQAIVAFEASRDISGVVTLRVPAGKKAEHLGIKVQFIGRIDMGQGVHESRPHYDFLTLSRELSPPGVLYDSQTEIPFLFRNMDKEHESYKGRNVAVRYFVKVVIERKFLPPITKEHDVWVQILGQEPTDNEAIKMEVGIEDCLHIEFEYERRVFHLQDTISGKIHFMLVRIKIKHMELAVIRRETSGEGVASSAGGGTGSHGAPIGTAVDVNNICTETQTLVKYEIMDGAPVKGEVIPVRLCLKGLPASLTPTYNAVNNRFSVRYFLNLVLVDAEDRRYFKQQEIILWRKELG